MRLEATLSNGNKIMVTDTLVTWVYPGGSIVQVFAPHEVRELIEMINEKPEIELFQNVLDLWAEMVGDE